VQLPDLTGQPPWVVVVVFGLFVLGVLGLAWLRRTGRTPEDDPPAIEGADTVTPLDASGNPYAVAQRALDHLAEVARRADAESAEERSYRRSLADRVEELTRELEAVTAQLAECERRAEALETERDA
jgi:hypothetical protein